MAVPNASVKPVLCVILSFLMFITCSIAGAAGRATVSFSPNWASAFTYESVTLTCNVASTAQGDPPYSWYKDGAPIGTKQQKYTIVSAQVSDSGEYQCKSHNSDRSEAVTLTVSNGYLALKVPPYVFEGDNLQVSCAGYPGYYTDTAKLYKGNQLIGGPSSSVNFNFGRVTMATSGSYTCYRAVKHHFIYYNQESSVYISVKELFSTPQIKVRPDQVIEGDHMTITCDTKLSPHRETTELQFAFYRNGHNVQGFSLSNQYLVPSAQLEDSGYYTCEIRAQSGSVKKKSGGKSIQITTQNLAGVRVRLEPAGGQVIAGEKLEILCSVEKGMGLLRYSWCKQPTLSCVTKEAAASEQRFVVESVSEDYGGEYRCIVTRTATGESMRSANISISVQVKVGKPELKLSPTKVAVGDSVDLLCESKSGSFPVDYQFYHRNDSIGKGKAKKKEEAQYRVTITSTSMAGPYYCALQNEFSSKMQLSDGVNLSVMEPVADARITPGEDELAVIVEDNLCLTCSVAKGTNPLFLWFYNNETIEHESVLYQVRESGKVLCIESAQLQHAGTYWCQVRNQLSSNRIFSVTSNNATISISGGYVVMGIGISLASLVLLLVTAIVAFKYRSKTASSFTNCCHFPTSSGKVQFIVLANHYKPNDGKPEEEQPEYGNIVIQDAAHGKDEGYDYYMNYDPTGMSSCHIFGNSHWSHGLKNMSLVILLVHSYFSNC
uniref:Ig-like domain-containing protein n=1 Tax=Xenopus tropicalis TaxID=8364 RepID=F6R7K8_XENTR